jgi:glucokinase
LLNRYNQLANRRFVAREVKDIFDRAIAGESTALKVWQEFSYSLGMFLSGMINIFNPETIIFGGGVSGAFKIFKPMVYQVIKQQAMWPQVKGLKLVKAQLNDAGIIGAALLAKENMQGPIK